MKSNFTIKCPCCLKTNDFTGHRWENELLEDSETLDCVCIHCGVDIEVKTNIYYTLVFGGHFIFDGTAVFGS